MSPEPVHPRWSGDEVRVVKSVEWWPLLRAVVPLIGAASAITVGYAAIAATTEATYVLWGVPLLLAGLVCAVLGLRTRLRYLREPDSAHTEGYGLLFLGWALVVVGMLLPWYVFAD